MEGSTAPSGNFRLNSTAAPSAVERRPQPFHRHTGSKPIRATISGVLATVATAALLLATPVLDPAHLPTLPERGLVRQVRGAVVLETIRGRPLGVIRGFQLAIPGATHGAVLRKGARALFAIDRFERRVRRVVPMPSRFPGCTVPDATQHRQLLVCGRHLDVVTLRGGSPQRRVVAGARRGLGHWTWGEFSPDGSAILAQWSGECESPAAYLVAGGRVRPYGRSDAVETFALGWLPDGRAVVSFWSGICGAGVPTPGVYAVARPGNAQLLRPFTRQPAPLLAMWGG